MQLTSYARRSCIKPINCYAQHSNRRKGGNRQAPIEKVRIAKDQKQSIRSALVALAFFQGEAIRSI